MNFIELNFTNQGEVQHEIVPAKNITGLFIELPDKKVINIRFSPNGHTGVIVERKEYYESPADCMKRWCQLHRLLGCENNAADPKAVDPFVEYGLYEGGREP